MSRASCIAGTMLVHLEEKPVKRLRTLDLHLQGVGKSCLVLRYVRGAFDPSSKVTIGAAFMSHSTRVASGDTVKFEIWCVLWNHFLCKLPLIFVRVKCAPTMLAGPSLLVRCRRLCMQPPSIPGVIGASVVVQ